MTDVFNPSTGTKNAMLDAAGDRLDNGPGPGTIGVYVGTTEVATATCSDPAWAPASGGSKSLNPMTDDTNCTGNASPVDICRMKDSTGAEHGDTSVGLTGKGLNLTTLTLAPGDTFAIDSGTMS